MGKNVIIYGVDMRPFVYIDNKKKDILILGCGPAQGLDDTTLTAEAQYFISFSRWTRKFCLSLCYNESSNFLFVNATKNIKSKQKILKKKTSVTFRKYFR